MARVHYPLLSRTRTYAQAKSTSRRARGCCHSNCATRQCLPLCNRLQLPIKATGLADTRTLIIPVAHTIFWAGLKCDAMGLATA